MAQNDYLKLPNQGNIASNLRLLYEMSISDGYADSQNYFSKRSVAEIAANALLLTTGNKMGGEVVGTLDGRESEEMNPALQNAKMRMQILRLLGLLSTDYDSEIYAITRLGELITPDKPNKRLLLELFMNICADTEVYEHNCSPLFRCYPGYQICYALACLEHKISVQEMPIIMTYSIEEISDFVKDAQKYRLENKPFGKEHPHFPRTQKGTPLNQPSNLTRTSNQILRYCGILERKSVKAGKSNYYVCTEEGAKYVDNIKRQMDASALRFLPPIEFRKLKIGQQKQVCKEADDNILARANVLEGIRPSGLVFSPYQMIPETNVNWLLECENRGVLEKYFAQTFPTL